MLCIAIAPPMKDPLRIIAGAEARRRIESEGFSLDLFDTFIGASGGPKWLTLYGIDQALAEPMAARTVPMNLIGSSIGAMRMACYAQADPRKAFARFLESYVSITLEEFSRTSLADFIVNTFHAALEGDAAREILANETLHLHVVTARANGPALPDVIAPATMALPAALNALHPSLLGVGGIRRALFVSNPETVIARSEVYPGHRVQLTEHNVKDALIASGSIPGLLPGIRGIHGAPRGTYWDGGITDYHFDPHWHTGDGLILYPHFSPTMVPGWFDKPFRRRHLDPAAIDRLVLLTPSEEFVANLPHQKIPDRRDVRWLSPEQMNHHWNTTVAESERLGDALLGVLQSGGLG